MSSFKTGFEWLQFMASSNIVYKQDQKYAKLLLKEINNLKRENKKLKENNNE